MHGVARHQRDRTGRNAIDVCRKLLGKTFGYNGTLPPVVAAWLPNLVFTALGGIGLWKTRK